MSLPDVGKPSLYYNLLCWSVYPYFNLYFRKFTVIGRENIPVNKPVIFAANHQNALMDALTVLFAARGEVVFLGRADLFRKRFIARMLYSFRILPVYRIRDGISAMGQNEATFEKAAEVLKNGTPLALFPEGNHAGFKRLRSLKKGICRIAFLAEEKMDFTLDLQIVPTGIDYSNYADPGAQILVQYGKPIPVAEFIPLYCENPQKALSALRDKIFEGLKPLMIHIASEEYYEVYTRICQLYQPEVIAGRKIRNTHHNRLLTEQEIIAGLDRQIPGQVAEIEVIKADMQDYHMQLKKYGLKDWLFQRNKTRTGKFILDTFITLLLLPFHLYGLIINYLPYKLPLRFTRNVEDQIFHSSIHFVIGLIVFPIYHLILLVIFSLLTKGLLIKILFALSLPLSGIFTFYYYKHLLKLRGRFRLLRLRFTGKVAYAGLTEKRNGIIRKIKNLIQVP